MKPVLGSPQSLNRYAYTVGDPVNLSDPLGLAFVPAPEPNPAGGLSWDSDITTDDPPPWLTGEKVITAKIVCYGPPDDRTCYTEWTTNDSPFSWSSGPGNEQVGAGGGGINSDLLLLLMSKDLLREAYCLLWKYTMAQLGHGAMARGIEPAAFGFAGPSGYTFTPTRSAGGDYENRVGRAPAGSIVLMHVHSPDIRNQWTTLTPRDGKSDQIYSTANNVGVVAVSSNGIFASTPGEPPMSFAVATGTAWQKPFIGAPCP